MEPNEIVRAPMVHELKCWPEYYDAVERGDKPFEIRKWDRPYQVGDTLLLQEYDPETRDYTDRQIRRKITYLLDMTYLPGDNIPHFAGYVVLGLENPRLSESQRRERAAVKDLAENISCGACVYKTVDVRNAPCDKCGTRHGFKFEWRGPSEEWEEK